MKYYVGVFALLSLCARVFGQTETVMNGPYRFTGTVKVESNIILGNTSVVNTMRVIPKAPFNGANAVTEFYENSDPAKSSYMALGVSTTTWAAPVPGAFIWSNANANFPVRDFFFWMGPNPDINKPAMFIKAATNAVGINTRNVPVGYMLAVNGGIIAEKMKVELNGQWPDYVFSSGYQLPTLSELAAYIDENKHLPDIPSADSMKSQGIDLAQMNVMLLKKIEEQALYILQLNKRLEALEEKKK
jgi:hypothetical protein